jgi:hypothetical protein
MSATEMKVSFGISKQIVRKTQNFLCNLPDFACLNCDSEIKGKKLSENVLQSDVI